MLLRLMLILALILELLILSDINANPDASDFSPWLFSDRLRTSYSKFPSASSYSLCSHGRCQLSLKSLNCLLDSAGYHCLNCRGRNHISLSWLSDSWLGCSCLRDGRLAHFWLSDTLLSESWLSDTWLRNSRLAYCCLNHSWLDDF